MSKIYIYDCDWVQNPLNNNVLSMKLSSYHTQLGDDVHLLDKT